MNRNYQELFNETLTKIRYAVSGAVYNDAPLMKSIVKTMYDFSDALVENDIIDIGQRTGENGRERN